MLIRHVLDVAGEDVDAQFFHVFGGFCHYLVGERVAVRVDGPQRQGADNLTHVALKGVLKVGGDSGRLFVQEVPHGQLHPLLVVRDSHFGHSVHHNVDKVVGGDVLVGLDVHRDLPQIQFIQLLEEGNLDPGASDEHTRSFAQARDDKRVIRRSLYITLCDDDKHHNDR